MEKIKNLDKFAERVAKQFKEDGMFSGVVCCPNCAASATKFLIENYPACLITVRSLNDGFYLIMCQATYEKEEPKGDEDA